VTFAYFSYPICLCSPSDIDDISVICILVSHVDHWSDWPCYCTIHVYVVIHLCDSILVFGIFESSSGRWPSWMGNKHNVIILRVYVIGGLFRRCLRNKRKFCAIRKSGKSRWFCSKLNGFRNSNENVPHCYATISSVVFLYSMPYIFLLNKVENFLQKYLRCELSVSFLYPGVPAGLSCYK
jgi:hypothetical protein